MSKMRSQYVFGTETELGIVVDSANDIRPAAHELAPAIVRDLAGRYPSLPTNTPEYRIFLGNGASVYVDIGGHPEIATAECTNPIELVSHTLALRQMLAESAETVSKVYGIPVKLICNNVDYCMAGLHTYGFHLNVSVNRGSMQHLADQLLPLLAAMPIIAGAGKVSFANGTSGFELSQRAAQMSFVLGKGTTDSKAMITCKDDPLGRNKYRLHLISLDSTMSQWQLALVPAIIVLALKVTEMGTDVAGPVALVDPVRALRAVSGDPSLSVALPLQKGGFITALDILDHYHDVIAQHIEQTEIPNWVRQMVYLWGDIIESLRTDPFREYRLDWVNKLLILTRQLAKVNLDWKEYSRWLYVLASTRRFRTIIPDIDPLKMTRSFRDRLRIPQSILGVLEADFVKNNLSWKEFGRIWLASNQLCQRCLQYHILTTKPKSVILSENNDLVTKDLVDKACNIPPAGSRAAVRGEAIRKAKPGATAGWTFVEQNGKRLVMDDALGTDATWQQVTKNTKKEK